jgi:hypothetical protein
MAMVGRELGFMRTVLASLTLAVMVTACGTAKAPGTTAQGTSLAVRVSPSPLSANGPGKAAQTYALHLLAKLQLPPGAQRTAWAAWRSRLIKPVLPVFLHDVVTASLLYRVKSGIDATSGFLAGHVPPGMKPGEGSGQIKHRGATEAKYVNYTPVHLPSAIASATLATAIVPDGSSSLLFAVAQVVWQPQRSAAEYIQPGGYQSVTIELPSGSGTSSMTRTFTSPAVITQLASLLNRLPAEVPNDSSVLLCRSPPTR